MKGRPSKEQSYNHFSAFVDATLKVFTAIYKRRVSMENLFGISKRAGVEKCRVANVVTELGFSCEKNLAESNRLCAICATKF